MGGERRDLGLRLRRRGAGAGENLTCAQKGGRERAAHAEQATAAWLFQQEDMGAGLCREAKARLFQRCSPRYFHAANLR